MGFSQKLYWYETDLSVKSAKCGLLMQNFCQIMYNSTRSFCSLFLFYYIAKSL